MHGERGRGFDLSLRELEPGSLSIGEQKAEWIFQEATQRRLLFTEACMLARNLESRSAVGAAYLRWLLRAFPQPPRNS